MKKTVSVILALLMLLSAFTAGTSAFAADTGWQKIGGSWYYFDEDGDAKCGDVYQIGGKNYAFDDNGRLVTKKGWYAVTYDDGEGTWSVWYYLNGKGVCLTGWLKIGDDWYYFDDDFAAMANAPRRIDDKIYLFAADGKLVQKEGWFKTVYNYYYGKATGEAYTGWKKIGKYWYYFDGETDGSMARDGGYWIDGKAYFFTNKGAYYKKKNGWLAYKTRFGDKQYYYFSNGKLVTGWKKIGKKTYYFLYNGVMATGITYVEKNHKLYYFAANGALKKYKGWKTIDGEKYYFTKKGYLATGWQKIGGKRYCFNTYDGSMFRNGIYYVYTSEAYYCFNKKGQVRKGWIEIDGSVYYAGGNGKLASGWTVINGDTYYFSEWGGEMATGAYEIDGVWYYFDEETGIYEKGHPFG